MRDPYEGKALQMVSGYRTGCRPKPLVSCLMPTADRREFIPCAIRCFKNQDYENLELIILDDGEQEIRDLIPSDPRIRYIQS
jgi:glycosyltransferase involved in cell wall biosynthesis